MQANLELLMRTSSKPAEIWDAERVCRFLHTSLQVYQKQFKLNNFYVAKIYVYTIVAKIIVMICMYHHLQSVFFLVLKN